MLIRSSLAILLALAALPRPTLAAPPVHAELRVRAIAADGAPLAGERIVLSTGAGSVSARLDARGSAVLPLPSDPTPSSLRFALAHAEAEAGFYPILIDAEAANEREERVLIFVPFVWPIRGGAHAGSRISVDLEGAFRPGCPECSSFFRRMRPAPEGYPDYPIPTWPSSAIPISVAIDRRPPAVGLLPRDSVALWSTIRRLEAILGDEPLFRTAVYRETLPRPGDDAPGNVLLVSVEPGLSGQALGSAVSHRGSIFFGAVRLRTAAYLHDVRSRTLVAHEFLHALGLGHTCSWPSILAELRRCPALQTPEPTPEDVAHYQLLSRVRELQRDHPDATGLEEAHRALVDI